MTCGSARSHIVDSRFFSTSYTTDEARRIFCDYRRMQRWLDVEVALALSQAELGTIPLSAAQELADTARLDLLDRDAIRSDIKKTGHSLIPLLNAWQNITSPEAGRYIHYGATTQDIQDTAQSLEIRELFGIVERDTNRIIQQLTNLVVRYRDLVTIGRTHGQHALPITMGAKMAVWLDEMIRHGGRLKNCKKQVLTSQLFGGVGSMTAFDDQGIELLKLFSARLGLTVPLCSWHTARDRLAEMLSTMAILAGTLGKIANEICQLARDEIGELEEPFHMGKIGSTTMPHKRNPELCEQVVVLARLIKNNAALGFEALINEHERDYRAIRLEWATITDTSLYICGALSLMNSILENLIVHEEKIQQNVNNAASMIGSEALMFLLAEKIGKQPAHQILYEISMKSRNTGRPLFDVLMEHPDITSTLTVDEVRQALDPKRHIGLALQLTDQVIEAANAWLAAAKDTTYTVPPCPLQGTGRCDD